MAHEFPAGDDEFEDKTIESVRVDEDGPAIVCIGWSLWCGKDCPVTPEAGQTARMYGRGIGYTTRGLFIDGVKIWYRSPAEEKDHHEVTLYGADAAEWLARWDAGKTVHTIEMGGLGPGYEQCIHIVAAEILRWLLASKPATADMEDKEKWPAIREEMDRAVCAVPAVKALGMSGAQWGAAISIATALYIKGPRHVLTDERVKDRHIMVSRFFPQAA